MQYFDFLMCKKIFKYSVSEFYVFYVYVYGSVRR